MKDQYSFKKITCLLFFLSIFISAFPQPPIQWLRVQGGDGDEFVNGVVESALDSNYIFTGTTTSVNNGDVLSPQFVNNGPSTVRDAWIYKVNKNTGLIMPNWGGCFGGIQADQLWRTINTSNGAYAAIGISSSTALNGNHGGGDVFIVQMTVNGQLSWQRCYGDASNNWGDNMVQATNGNLVFIGKTGSATGTDFTGAVYKGGTSDLWIAEVDKNPPHDVIPGRTKCLGGSMDEDYGCIANTSDGGYIVCCRSNSTDGDVLNAGNHGSSDAWIVKLNSSLVIQWSKCYGGTSGDNARHIFQDTDGNYVASGNTSSNDGNLLNVPGAGQGGGEYWMLKIDSGGTHSILWQKACGGTSLDFALCGVHASIGFGGGYYICGRTLSPVSGDVTATYGGGDCWIAKLNESNPGGPLDWVKNTGGSVYDGANWMIESKDGGIVSGGETRSVDNDIFTFCPNCLHSPTNVIYEESMIYKFASPSSTSQIDGSNEGVAVYPNPFSTQTTIKLWGDEIISDAQLNVFDLIGNKVKNISGINSSEIIFDRDGLAPGIYIYKVVNKGKVIATGKLIAQ